MEYTFEGGIVGRSNGSPEGDSFMRSMISFAEQQRSNASVCATRLREMGVKIATPDDGWVDRIDNTVTPPTYAMFNNGAEVGDLIALGSSTSEKKIAGEFRIVTVEAVRKTLFGFTVYQFSRRQKHIKIELSGNPP